MKKFLTFLSLLVSHNAPNAVFVFNRKFKNKGARMICPEKEAEFQMEMHEILSESEDLEFHKDVYDEEAYKSYKKELEERLRKLEERIKVEEELSKLTGYNCDDEDEFLEK